MVLFIIIVSEIIKIHNLDSVTVEFIDGLEKRINNLDRNIRVCPTREEWDQAVTLANRRYGGEVDKPLYPYPNEIEQLDSETLSHF